MRGKTVCKRFFVVFLIFTLIAGVILVLGIFKDPFVEALALDVWNEISEFSADLPIKNSMGPVAWKVFYIIAGIGTGILLLLTITLGILGFKKEKEKTSTAEKAEKALKKTAKKSKKNVEETVETTKEVAETTKEVVKAQANSLDALRAKYKR